MSNAPQAIPWNPIPGEANVYVGVNVMHIEQLARTQGLPLAIVIWAPLRTDASKEPASMAWRIVFRYPAAFRYWDIGLVDPWPAKDAHGQPGLWEVVHSPWLAQIANSRNPHALHHYVITDFESAYEVAAAWWEVEELGELDAVRIRLGLDHLRTKRPPL